MSSIFCATDFGPMTDRAVQLAAALARRFGDDLELFHVIPTYHLPAEVAVAASVTADAALRTASEAALARIAAEIAAPGLHVSGRVVAGPPVDQILGRADETQPRLVVVGRHARSGAARLFVGSVAERVVSHAHHPVLIVPPEAPVEPWTANRPLRIVVGLGASPASEAVLSWVRGLRERVPCDLLFVHTYAPDGERARLGLDFTPDPFDADPEVVEVLERELNDRIGDLPGRGSIELRVRPTFGQRPERLSWEAETEGADLVIVGNNQRRAPWAASHAVETLRAAHVPVLSVPASLRPSVAAPAPVKPIRRVLAATDLSDLANAAVPEAYRLLRDGGGTVEICYVASARNLDDADREALVARLRELAPRRAAALGIATRPVVVSAPGAAQGILQVADRSGADVIVVGSHGRGGVGRAVVGSVADEVMRHAKRPVLVVRR